MRTSLMIQGGNIIATITDYQVDKELGPIYTMTIGYKFNLRFLGQESGNVEVHLPEFMLEQSFSQQLKNDKSIDMQSFIVEYGGQGKGNDGQGNRFERCTIAHVHDIKPGNLECRGPVVSKVTDLQVHLKVKPSSSLLGVVQLDMGGQFQGIPFSLGLDQIY